MLLSKVSLASCEYLNLLTPVAAKNAWLLLWYLSNNLSNIQKIFEGELLIRTLSKTLLHIFYKFMHHSKIILNSMTGPDDTCQVNLQA